MDWPDGWKPAIAGFRRALAENRLAHAYLVVGSSRADHLAFCETILQHLFCGGDPPRPCGKCPGCRQCRDHSHPDAVWIEPESRGRQITIERIRETLLPRIRQTPFMEGGWRAAVLLDAECLNDSAANAFLKTLEEPPPKTLLLLATAAPRRILPTVVSRCHRLTILSGEAEASVWRERALALIAQPLPRGGVERLGRVRAFKQLLEEVRKAAAEEIEAAEPAPAEGENAAEVDPEVWEARINARVLAIRTEIIETLLLWQRDIWLLAKNLSDVSLRFPERSAELKAQAATFTPAAAAAAVRQVEALQRRLDRNLPVEQALESFFDALPHPRAAGT